MNKYLDIKSTSDAILLQERIKKEQHKALIEQRYSKTLSMVSGIIFNELTTIGEIFFSKRKYWLFIIPIQDNYYRVTNFKNGETNHIWALELLKGDRIIEIYMNPDGRGNYHLGIKVNDPRGYVARSQWEMVTKELQHNIEIINSNLCNK